MKKVQKEGKVCILDIERQGVLNVKKSDLNAKFVYIKPPSFSELERRLRERKTDNEESIRARLDTAKEELGFAESVVHDHVIVNDDVDEAYNKLKHVLFTFE